MLISQNARAMNTWFQKPASKLATYREPGVDRGPPYESGRQEQLDFRLAPIRWANGITNVETSELCE
eukprot:8594510-Prorocentrum_lima.AAC.1